MPGTETEEFAPCACCTNSWIPTELLDLVIGSQIPPHEHIDLGGGIGIQWCAH